MVQSSQKVMSPSSGVNISGPVPGTFQHSKETSITLAAGAPKSAVRRPQIPIPNIPAQGELAGSWLVLCPVNRDIVAETLLP